MTQNQIRFRFNGPKYDNHQIDVSELAPALIALGDLCKIANKIINGNKAHVQVLVSANLNQNCFELNFQLVQSIYDHIKTLIHADNIASSKELLEWLGILGVVGSPFGLLKFLKWKGNSKVAALKAIKTKEGKNIVEVKIEGDNNSVSVYPQTMQIAENINAVKAARNLTKPLWKEGCDSLEFEYKGQITDRTLKEEAKLLAAVYEAMVDESEIIEEGEPQTIEVFIKVYSPVYDLKAPLWRFMFGQDHVYMDISETTIAKDAINRGGSFVDDTYKVVLEIRQTKKMSGEYTNTYTIKKVLSFSPSSARSQIPLFSEFPS